MATFQVFQ
ncbi:GM11038 [Drosophila sechellia]|uniref:GM11038 n=1 Tax=Drosophila sechellia TaxID=7238 RepID=B4HX65_DROSE|nr:GM11038 [Drosophila sechellia]